MKFDAEFDESGGTSAVEKISAITNTVNVSAVLNFIDLAGSERADSNVTSGGRTKSPNNGFGG